MSDLLREVASGLAKLRTLLDESQGQHTEIQRLLTALGQTLDDLWRSHELLDIVLNLKLSTEFLTLISSSKTTTIASRADSTLGHSVASPARSWLGDGPQYARWLGQGAASIMRLGTDHPTKNDAFLAATAFLVNKSLSFGYSGIQISCLDCIHL